MQYPRILLRVSFVVVFCFLLSIISNRATAVDDEFQFRYEIPSVGDLSGDTVLATISEGMYHPLVLTDYGWIDQGVLLPSRPLNPAEYVSSSVIDGDTVALSTRGSCGEFGPETNSAIFIFKRTGTTWSQQQEITLPCASALSMALDGNTLIFTNNTYVTDGDIFGFYTESASIYEFNGTSWASVATVDLDSDNCVCLINRELAVSGDTALFVGGSSSGYETLVYKRSGGVWSQQTTLPYSTADPDLDLDGDTAIVGESVYVTNGTTWTLQTTFALEPTSSYPPQVSIDGNQALLYDNIGYRLMIRNGTTWTEENTVFPNVTLFEPIPVVISGNRALFGKAYMSRGTVPNEVPYAFDSTLNGGYFLSGNTVLFFDISQEDPVSNLEYGTIYVRNSSGIWEKQAGITTPGRPVALQGDTAVFATSGDENTSTDGTLIIYERSGTTWTQQQVLQFNSNFGDYADIDGDTILVSDPGIYDTYNQEVVFVEFNGTSWEPTENFAVDDGPGASRVAISGDLALATVDSGNDDYFRTFQRVNGTWTEKAALNTDRILWFDLNGNTALIENSVYVFDGTSWSLQATLTPNESVAGRLIGAIEGNTIVLAGEDKSFVFTRSGTTWTQQQKLMLGGLDIGYKLYADANGYTPNFPLDVRIHLENNVALVPRYTFDIGGAPVDPTPTPVVTEEPTGEPTSGPTSTPTSPDTPLNQNTSFENANGLEPWKLKDASGDRLKCSTEKPIAHSGNCAFQFKNANSSGKLQQVVSFSDRGLLPASELELSLFARTKGGATGTAKVVVSYGDGSKQKFSVDIADAQGTYNKFHQIAALIQTGAAKAKIVVKGTNNRGKFLVDDVTLSYVEGNASFSVLPLPAN